MRFKVAKMRFVCLALIFILHLHTICADFILHSLARKMTAAVSSVRHFNGALAKSNGYNNKDINLTPAETIKRDKYPSETHTVITEDGYILTVFRIPGPPGSTPVLLQHGLLESSADWLIPGRGRSLAYLLADNGYDVWLGNARGNTYSKKHKTLATSDPKFWDFSWQELGKYDLPAVITHITNLKKDGLFYVGHSMAGTTFSVMAIERPEIAQKVKAMIGLAPATYVYHMKGPIKLFSPFWSTFQRLAYAIGIYEILPRSMFFDAFAEYICNSVLVGNVVCSNSLFFIAGFSPEELNYSLLPEIWRNFPAGTSIKLFTHWLQQMTVNKIRKFDYGLTTNLKVYNSTEPPEYDLSKIQVPIAIFWAENDWLVGPKDIQNFYNQIPSKWGIHKVEDPSFNHLDFLWAVNAPKLVYSKVLDLLVEYNNQIIR